jgi:ribokinase
MTAPIADWDVVVLGGVNTDFLVRGTSLPGPGMSLNGTVFTEAPGGKGANVAVAAARLGSRTALIGHVGDDARGHALIDHLRREGVHIVHVTIDRTAPTGAAVIQVDQRGQKQILAALGANLSLSRTDLDAAARLIRTARVLVAQLEVPLDCVSAARDCSR